MTVTTNTDRSTHCVTEWFEDFIISIKVDKLAMETNTAPKEKKELYDAMINNEYETLIKKSQELNHRFYIQSLIKDYFEVLFDEFEKRPLKLALDYSNNKVLVWAEVRDDDEDTIDALLLTEAKVNAKYYQDGFHISSTILEESDEYPIPSHYKSLLN